MALNMSKILKPSKERRTEEAAPAEATRNNRSKGKQKRE